LEIVKSLERSLQKVKVKEKKERRNDHWDWFLLGENVLFLFRLKGLLQQRIRD